MSDSCRLELGLGPRERLVHRSHTGAMAARQHSRPKRDSVAALWFQCALMTAGARWRLHREMSDEALLRSVLRNYRTGREHMGAARRQRHNRAHVAA